MFRATAGRLLIAIMFASVAACTLANAGEPTGSAGVPIAAQPTGDGILLLGTAGGPLARADRSGIATLLMINGQRYLVDAGEGVVRQLGIAGMQPADIPTVFLTHLHDDHYSGLPSVASFAWTVRSPRIDIYGPEGTADLVSGIWQVMAPNARIRMAEQGINLRPEDFAVAHEYVAGEIFDDGNVRVSALANSHFDLPPESPAASSISYSLRFQTGDRSVVFTGDTGPSAAVAEFAKGADVLVAEMASLKDRESAPPFVQQHMDREHLSPLEVGKLAKEAGVKTVVLTHVGEVGEADLAIIRSAFAGEVILGSDLERIAL